MDFTNTLIILTSNLGSSTLPALRKGRTSAWSSAGDGRGAGALPAGVPQPAGRIILFHRLGHEHMAPIVDLQVARVQTLLKDRKIVLDLTEGARKWLGASL